MLALSGDVQFCVSDAIFDEYEEVIRRPHFKRSAVVIEGTLQSIRKLGHWVKPGVCVQECADPDDNMFLECAQLPRRITSSPAINVIFPNDGRRQR